MHRYQDLKLCQKSIDLVVGAYQLTASFPKEEKYGLVSQIQRCSVSIPSNIAEGAGWNSEKEFIHFLSIANGSCYELETQILVAQRLGFINTESADAIGIKLQEVQKMSYVFQQKLKTNQVNLSANQ